MLRPFCNAIDLARRPSDKWIIDFGTTMSMEEASLFEVPFQHVLEFVKPQRDTVRRKGHRENWWRYGEARPGMRARISKYDRFIATPEVSKHRFFVMLDSSVMPSNKVYAITKDDFVCLGILSSRFHECWSLAMGSWHGVGNDPRYTNTSTFNTYPFPEGLTPNREPCEYENEGSESIAAAAEELSALRINWLNPNEWTDVVPEVAAKYPDRILPKAGHEDDLKRRTLTNLYNENPVWLQNANKKLDEAVAAAYGWSADLSDDEILANLLELNLSRQGV